MALFGFPQVSPVAPRRFPVAFPPTLREGSQGAFPHLLPTSSGHSSPLGRFQADPPVCDWAWLCLGVRFGCSLRQPPRAFGLRIRRRAAVSVRRCVSAMGLTRAPRNVSPVARGAFAIVRGLFTSYHQRTTARAARCDRFMCIQRPSCGVDRLTRRHPYFTPRRAVRRVASRDNIARPVSARPMGRYRAVCGLCSSLVIYCPLRTSLSVSEGG